MDLAGIGYCYKINCHILRSATRLTFLDLMENADRQRPALMSYVNIWVAFNGSKSAATTVAPFGQVSDLGGIAPTSGYGAKDRLSSVNMSLRYCGGASSQPLGVAA